ncbi:MAG: hypothetical protein ACJZ9F_08395 [Rhodospirillaceae bacterium]
MILSVATPTLILIGLSQIYSTGYWESYYRWLSSMGSRGVRFNGLISLAISGPIVTLHNVWSGPPILLTLFGWLLLTESALCLFLPGAGLAGLAEVEEAARRRIIVGTGAALVIVGGVLATHLLTVSG